MGLLAPIGYIMPGIAIDLILLVSRKLTKDLSAGIMLSSIVSSVIACLTATVLVFRLSGIILLLYVFVSATSGSVCGLLAVSLVNRIRPVIFSYKEAL